jgi:YD repeat-containing protein
VVIVTANHPPVVTGQTVTTAEDTPVPITLTASDPEGDPVAFAVGAAGHGQVTGVPPTVTYTPAPDFNGTDTFTVTANDGHDQSQPATVTVNVTEVNDPPVAKPDSATTGTGQPTTVTFAKLLANDGAGPFDERNQTLTVTAVTPGADTHGTVQTSLTALTYTPDPAFDGTAVIAYTVCDDGTTGGSPDPQCADSTVSIGHNQAPTANPQSAQTSRTGPVDLTLTAGDPEDDPLTFAITAQPGHGTLTGTPPDVRYKANAGFVGTDTFTFTASDAFSTSAPATVTITVNDVPAPTLTPDSVTLQPGASVLIAVLANDTPGSGALDPATMTIGSAPTRGVAAVEATKIRYTAGAGETGADAFSYTVCDTAGGCATAQVSVVISENHAPVAAADSYDVAAGTTLNIAAPGVLGNDSDPDAGDRIQARLVQGVTNGNLLLYSTGAFTYTPHGPGIDTFVYHLVDRAGLVSNDVTVTITVSGPPGPPIVGNNLYQVQQGNELTVAAPGVLDNDYSPDPRLGLTVLLQRDAAKGSLVLQPNGSFVYTPVAGYTGIDQFSYVVRDAEGRVSQEGRVGITVTSGGPATATIGSTSPVDGTVVYGPTQFTATLLPPTGETVTSWTVAYRQPGGATLIPLGSGTGNNLAANFDPTLVRNGTYSIVVRALTSGGGVLVNETGLIVDGEYKPGRYTTTYRDAAVTSANVPIDVLRTYDSTNKTGGDFGPGWSLAFGGFTLASNGPLGAGTWTTFTCGSFPFLATCYQSSKPHIVTVTWPDGHVDRFRFTPNQGSQLVPTITTAGFTPEPGTTSTLQPVGSGLLLSGGDFLLGDFFSSDGVYDPVQFVLTDQSGVKYRIDKRAGLLSITDRNGNELSLGSDGFVSSAGIAMSFVRDASNRITRIVAPGGNIDYGYDAAGDLVGVSYPNGTQQTFTYDAQHNLLTTSGGGQLVRTLQYDASGRLTSITDGNGHTTTIDSDVAGHQVVVTDATGQLTSVITYDDRGNEIQRDRIAASQSLAIAAAGELITTKSTYDSLGRQLTRTDGLGHTTTWTYDAAGNVLSETDPNGKTTTFTYNALGQLLTTTDPLGHTTSNTYDSKGNVLSSTDANGKTTSFTYDAAGNLLTTTDPVGRVTTRSYDSNGYLEQVRDPGGNLTHQTVDPNTGLLTSVTDPTGATWTYGYDEVGHLTRITDPNGHSKTATYDAFDRVTVLTDPTGTSVHMTYDSNNNLTSVTDRNAQTIAYTYDANSRLLSKNVPGAGITTFTYDAFGRLTDAHNAVADLAFTYDAADHVLAASSTPVVAGALPSSTFIYTYDAAGNVLSTQGPGGQISYGYDAKSQLTSITDPASGLFNLGYDNAGLQTSLTRPNGITDSATYNAAGDLIGLHSTLGATLVGQADYAYNAAGLRSSYTSQLGTTSYTYDGAAQLTSATPPAGSGLPDEQYTYDGVGNRTSSATSPLGSFSYNSGDRLLGDAATAYTYDNEGNLVTRTDKATGATTTYTWTAEHQLVGITYPDGSTSTVRYDPLGRRVEVADGSATRRYAYDQQTIAAEYDGTNTLAAHYVHPGLENPCPLEMVRDGQRYFYLADGQQSVTALTNMAGAVVASYRYQAFGIPIEIGTLENPFQYLCLWIYGIAGLGFGGSGTYDPSSSQSLNDNPIDFPNPNPFRGGNPMVPPPSGGSGGAGPGHGGGGNAGEEAAGPCDTGAEKPRVYPKGWWGLMKGPKKLLSRPKTVHPKKGAGTEYISVLPKEEDIQAIADFGWMLRCQFETAANALS